MKNVTNFRCSVIWILGFADMCLMHMLDILSFNLPEAQHGMEMVQWIRDKGMHNVLT